MQRQEDLQFVCAFSEVELTLMLKIKGCWSEFAFVREMLLPTGLDYGPPQGETALLKACNRQFQAQLSGIEDLAHKNRAHSFCSLHGETVLLFCFQVRKLHATSLGKWSTY